jgi:uncharacterized protein (UPF0261 family)
MISAGGGTGTHIATCIMHELPLGVPKVMVSTVASRSRHQRYHHDTQCCRPAGCQQCFGPHPG